MLKRTSIEPWHLEINVVKGTLKADEMKTITHAGTEHSQPAPGAQFHEKLSVGAPLRPISGGINAGDFL